MTIDTFILDMSNSYHYFGKQGKIFKFVLSSTIGIFMKTILQINRQ